MSSGVQRTITGSFIASGIAQKVLTVGFLPRRVKIFNLTHPGRLEWNDAMPADAAFKTIAAGTQTYITSAGITAIRDVTGAGFQIGAEAVLNQAGDLLTFEASE